ncbi:MAG: hypothetical protein GY847_02280 [Proteobacteria bacterium]|nr:hypothetical protein [Pseudomonadota bacterium]
MKTRPNRDCYCRRRHERQEGAVLLTVMLLVIMFTGLGLLAMRHTRGELRSAGAYLDSIQAAYLAEAAIAMAATDIRLYWDSGKCNVDDGARTYFSQLGLATDEPLLLGFSPVFQGRLNNRDSLTDEDNNCLTPPGQLPDDFLSGIDIDDLPVSLALTPRLSYPCASNVSITYELPVSGENDYGYSETRDSNQTYIDYYITIISEVEYGARGAIDINSNYVRGKARARARMKIGPVLKLSN